MKKGTFLAITLWLLTSQLYAQKEALRRQIAQLVLDKKATVAVAMLGLSDGDSLTFNGRGHYPMQSVYKFHLALAVLAQVDKGKFALNQPIFVKKSDLLPNTWSPMREAHPAGDVHVPLSKILEYTVGESDNNGCDLLFRLVGGPEKVNDYIHQLGVKDVAIAATEDEMHRDEQAQYTNWATPYSLVQLLDLVDKKPILKTETKAFLLNTMTASPTGPKRIKGQLPTGTVVAHKTGTSGTNAQGVASATNDVGIVTLPNGKKVAVAVLVLESRESNAVNEALIAEISKAIWDYSVSKK
jgi:beta-lactamase class A